MDFEAQSLFNDIKRLIKIFGTKIGYDCVFFTTTQDDPNYEYYKQCQVLIPIENKINPANNHNKENTYILFENYILTNFEFGMNYAVGTTTIYDGFEVNGTILSDPKVIIKSMKTFVNKFPDYKIKKHRLKKKRGYIGLRPKGSTLYIKPKNKTEKQQPIFLEESVTNQQQVEVLENEIKNISIENSTKDEETTLLLDNVVTKYENLFQGEQNDQIKTQANNSVLTINEQQLKTINIINNEPQPNINNILNNEPNPNNTTNNEPNPNNTTNNEPQPKILRLNIIKPVVPKRTVRKIKPPEAYELTSPKIGRIKT
jgi:hypothetical protein